MCGILGIINFTNNATSKEQLLSASKYINHRGPDHHETYINKSVAFAHARLSIIDLDPRSNQPFVSDDGQYILIFNGEIYNYNKLKADLIKKGINFRTTSDTEVLLNGFIEEGESFITKCEGIFSLGIWNRKEEKLFLCRDRFGIKPLYYSYSADRIIFSSEIKPILALQESYQVDYSVLNNFTRFRYHPGNETPFKNILNLEMGHWCYVGKNIPIKFFQYWSVDNSKHIIRINELEAVEQFNELLKKSVASQLIADVPVGVFLSGGVDSSSVFSLANSMKQGMHGFTLGFRTKDDEIELAKKICLERGGFFHPKMIENEDFDIYKKALWYLEEPLADSILSATYSLAEFARKEVKVVLSGEGADEILGGYIHHKFLTSENTVADLKLDGMLKFFLKFAPLKLLQSLFPYKASLGANGLAKLQNQVEYIGQWGLAYEKVVELFNEDYFVDAKDSESIWQNLWDKNPKSQDFLNTLTRFDLKYWNSRYTLLRLDKLTMAHGLEARVPFLDSELAAFTLSLPKSMKLKHGHSKWVLREAMYKNSYLQKDESFRKKQAFFLPIEKTYGKAFIEFAADTLLSKRCTSRGIINNKALKQVIDSDYSELLASKQLMALLINELWAQLYIDGEWKTYQTN